MFYGKKIKELEKKVFELESRLIALAAKVTKQSDDIDHLYALLVNQKPAVEEKPVAEQKPKRYRTRKKNGKENTEAAK